MDLGLKGKKALVTGATKGLGRAIAETLLAEGCSVAICARDAEGVSAAVSELNELGTACGSAVDAGDMDSLSSWINESAEELGGIDIYVHNTSGKPQRKLEGWINNFHIDLMSLVGGVGVAKTHFPMVAEALSVLEQQQQLNISLLDLEATVLSKQLLPTGR